MNSTNQDNLKIGTQSDVVRIKIINRTQKCKGLIQRGQNVLSQEVVQTRDLPHPNYFKTEVFNEWFSEVLLNKSFGQKSWKKTNIIGVWQEHEDPKGLVMRAIDRIE